MFRLNKVHFWNPCLIQCFSYHVDFSHLKGHSRFFVNASILFLRSKYQVVFSQHTTQWCDAFVHCLLNGQVSSWPQVIPLGPWYKSTLQWVTLIMIKKSLLLRLIWKEWRKYWFWNCLVTIRLSENWDVIKYLKLHLLCFLLCMPLASRHTVFAGFFSCVCHSNDMSGRRGQRDFWLLMQYDAKATEIAQEVFPWAHTISSKNKYQTQWLQGPLTLFIPRVNQMFCGIQNICVTSFCCFF